MVSDRFRLRYRLKPEHFLGYFNLVRMRTRGSKSWTRFLRPFLGGLLIGLILVVLLVTELVSHLEIFAGFIGAVLTLLAVSVYAVLINKKMVGRMIGTHDAMIGQFTLVAYDGGGIQITGKHITSSYEWSAFVDMSNGNDLLILWIDRGAGVIIPASAFPGEDERSQFADYVKERIKANHQTD